MMCDFSKVLAAKVQALQDAAQRNATQPSDTASAEVNEAKTKHESTQNSLEILRYKEEMHANRIIKVTRCACHLERHLLAVDSHLCIRMQANVDQLRQLENYELNNETEYKEFRTRQLLLIHQLEEAASEVLYNTLRAQCSQHKWQVSTKAEKAGRVHLGEAHADRTRKMAEVLLASL